MGKIRVLEHVRNGNDAASQDGTGGRDVAAGRPREKLDVPLPRLPGSPPRVPSYEAIRRRTWLRSPSWRCTTSGRRRRSCRTPAAHRSAIGLSPAGSRSSPSAAQRLRQIAVARLELLEQPHVLDRDDGLVGKGLQQCRSAHPVNGLATSPIDHGDRPSSWDCRHAASVRRRCCGSWPSARCRGTCSRDPRGRPAMWTISRVRMARWVAPPRPGGVGLQRCETRRRPRRAAWATATR